MLMRRRSKRVLLRGAETGRCRGALRRSLPNKYHQVREEGPSGSWRLLVSPRDDGVAGGDCCVVLPSASRSEADTLSRSGSDEKEAGWLWAKSWSRCDGREGEEDETARFLAIPKPKPRSEGGGGGGERRAGVRLVSLMSAPEAEADAEAGPELSSAGEFLPVLGSSGSRGSLSILAVAEKEASGMCDGDFGGKVDSVGREIYSKKNKWIFDRGAGQQRCSKY